MPTNIVDSNAFTSPVVRPNDTEAATAASLALFVQPLSNRTYYLQQLVEVLGIKKIRSGSAAAMVAATGVTNKTVWLVEAAGAFQGIYVYDSGSAFVADNSFVYPATGMGAGAWVHALFSLLNVNLGLVTLGPISLGGAGISPTPASKIDAAFIQYGNVQALFASPATGIFANSSSTSYVDIPNYSLSVPGAIAGDVLFIDMELKVFDVTGHFGNFKPVIVDGASTIDIDVPVRVDSTTASTLQPTQFHGAYTVVTGGTLTVKAQY
ncbi:MAG TPA: hypothetical protein VK550_17365, partial [Polyangiaceae bacterium]|nr:hypothetical protein [Polyangiaceae bacterium]